MNKSMDFKVKKMLNGGQMRIERPEEMIKKPYVRKMFKAYGAEIVPGQGIREEIRQKEKMKNW